ncbi:MAG: hypothetical protein IGR93_09565, partial [Hydrococcus sp. C42_A2020_068]|nr:hypothetical protein [Hydrococcus sp. C42_A2020_068]
MYRRILNRRRIRRKRKGKLFDKRPFGFTENQHRRKWKYHRQARLYAVWRRNLHCSTNRWIRLTADNIRKQFTGYERDEEIGLDFAKARMYKPSHGRFTSVDPENVGADEDYPQ